MKRYKVIYAGFSLPFYIELALKLKKLLWDPCYWIGRKEQIHNQLLKNFESLPFHDHHDAMIAKPVERFNCYKNFRLNKETINKFLKCEKISLKMMDRIDNSGTLKHSDRVNLYYDHLNYWINVFEEIKPDILFMVSTPHQIYDYILYEICKFKGIKTIMFGLGFDLNLIYIKNDFEVGSGFAFDDYNKCLKKKNITNKISKRSQLLIDNIQNKYEDAIPKKVMDQIEQKSVNLMYQFFIYILKRILKNLLFFLFCIKYLIISKHNKLKKITSLITEIKVWNYDNIISKIRIFLIKKYYNSLCLKEINFKCSYVYLPLSYQPELASSPEGDIFVDQLLMIKLIALNLPKDWKLYIKEHPVQFTYNLGTNANVRSLEFYDKIKFYKNVELIPMNITPFSLIDNAKAIATITGTSGWEALLRKKPVLYFGYPWWHGCYGSFFISNSRDIKNAFKIIKTSFVYNEEKIKLFINLIEKYSCNADLFWDYNKICKSKGKVKKSVLEMYKIINNSL